MYTLKFQHHFDAAHKLNDYEGACANLHGHRWLINVIVKGYTLNKTGILIDFKDLKKIIDELDHTYLNDIVPDNPTAENISKYLYEKINNYCSTLINISYVMSVEVFESPNASIIYEI